MNVEHYCTAAINGKVLFFHQNNVIVRWYNKLLNCILENIRLIDETQRIDSIDMNRHFS